MADTAAAKCSVNPFGIEADHPRNCDLLLQGIVNCRLRSRIIGSRPVKDKRSGHYVVPEDQAIGLGKYPEIPGMRLYVDPANLSYRIVDPLTNDPELCDRIKKQMDRSSGVRTASVLKGVPDQEGKLDKHRMKTLVREMTWLVNSGEARVIKGVLPSDEMVKGLDGKFLLNPGSTIPNTQPRFEEDYDAFVDSLNRVGG